MWEPGLDELGFHNGVGYLYVFCCFPDWRGETADKDREEKACYGRPKETTGSLGNDSKLDSQSFTVLSVIKITLV